MAHLLVHVEQYDVVGVLPSQLESLALLSTAMGIQQTAFVDATADGVKPRFGFDRYATFGAFLDAEEGPLAVFLPDGDVDVREFDATPDTWLVFGPAMGFRPQVDREVTRVSVPGGVLNSRDAAVIAMWEVSPWRAR